MLNDGEKGAVIQIDKTTYAIAPHTPVGIITPDLLRKIADAAEKYDVKLIKITSAYRIALYGVKEEDLDSIWQDLGMNPGNLTGLCVRSVRACPGNNWCKLGQRDSLALGLKLDAIYHGMQLTNKMKIAVAGCPINCPEGWSRDIGLFAQGKSKWILTAGGNAGSRPRHASEIIKGLGDEEAIEAVRRVVEFYKENSKRGERLGKTLERTGAEPLVAIVSDLAKAE